MVTSESNQNNYYSTDVESKLEEHRTHEASSTFSALNTPEDKTLREILSETRPIDRNENTHLDLTTVMEAKPIGAGRKKRGRKPAKVDVEARLQRSRQSARECRARKKMRYKLLEELIVKKETENLELRKELEKCLHWYNVAEAGGKVPNEVIQQYKEDLSKKKDSVEENKSPKNKNL